MNKPLPVKGYSDQPTAKIDLVNVNKELEERILRVIDQLAGTHGVDGRCVALARTNIQDGFMWLNRAIFQPQRISLPEDPEEASF